MTRQMLVTAEQLHQLQADTDCIIVDCRFNLADPDAGYQLFLKSHIPNATYANLDKDLSSPVTPLSGRHPLPEAEQFASFLSRIGWQPGLKLVAYDDMGGAFAARLWWLMKYFGLSGAALLDGGLAAWLAAGFPTQTGEVDSRAAARLTLQAQREMVMSASEVQAGLAGHEILLVDARACERFRGDVEPIDSVAGHVPGAKNLPLSQNLGSDGCFKPSEEIHRLWQPLQGDMGAGQVVHMCGSGVTACFNQFASELAGLQGSKLYAGSWSEWIRDPGRGAETGP